MRHMRAQCDTLASRAQRTSDLRLKRKVVAMVYQQQQSPGVVHAGKNRVQRVIAGTHPAATAHLPCLQGLLSYTLFTTRSYQPWTTAVPTEKLFSGTPAMPDPRCDAPASR